MSDAMAVAAVSFVLVDLLNNGLIDRDISSTGVGDVAVTALAPDLLDISAKGPTQLNLFLYQATPNPGWRNVGLPNRDASGARTGNPPLALDLHYLLMACGTKPLHAEILLGYAMQLLHETPILTRDAIRKSLSAPTQVSSGVGLPPAMLNLYNSELAEQVELIKIWPQTITTEEISRLWTAFQTNYRPTAAYQASVVLIKSKASTKTALPVQYRTVQAIPFQAPVISQVLSQETQGFPILDQPILPGYNLVLEGSQLKGEVTSVLFDNIEVFPPDANVKPTEIIVAIPAGLEAGSVPVQVVQQLLMGSPPALHRGVESNATSFILRPTIQAVHASGVKGSGSSPRSGSLDLTIDPRIGWEQQVQVLLNQILPVTSPPSPTALAYSFTVPPRIDLASPPPNPPPPTANISVPFFGVAAGTYVVRVLVDDGESLLGMNANGLFATPKVIIP
jgi:hypothetical protein